MKKIVALTAVVCLSASLTFAADEVRKERITDMKKMADGMSLIMNGFLYNYLDNVKEGVSYIKSATKSITDKKDLKHFLPEDTAYAYKFGEKSLRRIDQYATEVEEEFSKGNYDDSLESAMLIMRQCQSCHSKVRGW